MVLFDVRRKSRLVLNEEEVAEAMRTAMGGRGTVTVVDMASLSFSEQTDLLARTTILVGIHGSGMTNLLFLPHGAVVVELFPFGFTRPTFEGVIKSWFSDPRQEPRLHYLAWKNVYRERTVFHPDILDKFSVAPDARQDIMDAPRFESSMSWAANYYWINQDTTVTLEPRGADSAFLTTFQRALETGANAAWFASGHDEL
jgi:hypothetical protein